MARHVRTAIRLQNAAVCINSDIHTDGPIIFDREEGGACPVCASDLGIVHVKISGAAFEKPETQTATAKEEDYE